jgi:hypothetical protein
MVQEVTEVLIATALGVSVRVVWRYLQRCPPPKRSSRWGEESHQVRARLQEGTRVDRGRCSGTLPDTGQSHYEASITASATFDDFE